LKTTQPAGTKWKTPFLFEMRCPLFQQNSVQMIGNNQVHTEAEAVEENKTNSKAIKAI
jgi:hypothetical protein